MVLISIWIRKRSRLSQFGTAPYHGNVIRHVHVFNFMGYTITEKLKVVYPCKTHKKSYFNQINFASSTLLHSDTLLASIYFNASYCIKQNHCISCAEMTDGFSKNPLAEPLRITIYFCLSFPLSTERRGKGATRLSCKSKDQQFHYRRQHLKNNCDKDTNLKSASIFVSLCK